MRRHVLAAVASAIALLPTLGFSGAFANVISRHQAPPILRIQPTIVRAVLQPNAYPRLIASSPTRYAGTVTTLPGNFPAVQLLSANATTGGLIATIPISNYPNPSQTLLELVARDGHATPITVINGGLAGMVYDASKKLIYATEACTVVSISLRTGVVTPVAGSATCGTADGQGSNAQFQGPHGIALDQSSSQLYVVDIDRIRSVSETGTVKTITAPGLIGPPNKICFFGANNQGLTFDTANGDLYLADTCVEMIRQVVPTTGAVSTLAGECVPNESGECLDYYRDGQGAAALFAAPGNITYDALDGYLYVTDIHNNMVRRVSLSGSVTTVAGSGHAEFANGVGPFAGFSAPLDLVPLPTGAIAVSDSGNNSIRKIVVDGPPAPPPQHGIVLYDTPSIGEAPMAIAAAPDGSVWYSVPSSHLLGSISQGAQFTEYPLPGAVSPGRIAIDAANDVWFTNGPQIGEFSASHVLTQYPIPSGDNALDVAIGADGNTWFVGGQSIGYVTPLGDVYEYPTDPSGSMTAGYSPDLWTLGSLSQEGFVDEISIQGAILRRYALGNITAGPICRGPNGKVWIGQAQAIGEVLARNILLFQLPPAPIYNYLWNPAGLVEGPDQALWFTANLPGYVGRMAANGAFTPYEIPAPRSAPVGITVSTGGSIWFTDPGASKIGRWY